MRPWVCLLLYCQELMGEVRPTVTKEAGLEDMGVKKADFVGFPHPGQVQPEVALIDHKCAQGTAQ